MRQYLETTTPNQHKVIYYLPTAHDAISVRGVYNPNNNPYSFEESLLAFCIVEIDGVRFEKAFNATFYKPLEALSSFKDLNTLLHLFKAKAIFPTDEELLLSMQSTKFVQLQEEAKVEDPPEGNGLVPTPVVATV